MQKLYITGFEEEHYSNGKQYKIGSQDKKSEQKDLLFALVFAQNLMTINILKVIWC